MSLIGEEVFCSTIIPTVNRTTLSRAVASVLEQGASGFEFEVIVVNDSGRALPMMDWQQSPRVKIIETNQVERSEARNTGASQARGEYLHFLDDDDVLLSGAFQHFYAFHQTCDAAWIYGNYQTVDNHGNIVDAFEPQIAGNIFPLLVAGESVPLQASLIKRSKFQAVGGFDTNPKIIGVEDRDLGRRLALVEAVGYMPEWVARIRIGEQGSTTNWSTIAESDRLGREKALNQPLALRRILHSSYSNAYWRGRVSKACLGSIVWNIKHRRFSPPFKRLFAIFNLSIAHFYKPAFFRSMFGGR